MPSFTLKLKGKLEAALPAFTLIIPILGSVVTLLEGIISTIVNVAKTALDIVIAMLGFLIDIALSPFKLALDALILIRVMVAQIAAEIDKFQDASTHAHIIRYDFKGKAGDIHRAIERFFATGSPGAHIGPHGAIRSLLFLGDAQGGINFKALLGPHRASGVIRIPLPGLRRLNFGEPVVFSTDNGNKKYQPEHGSGPPFERDSVTGKLFIPPTQVKMRVPPDARARGKVRIERESADDLLLYPGWKLISGTHWFNFDWRDPVFEPAGNDPALLGWYRVKMNAAEISPIVHFIDLPVISENADPGANLKAGATFELVEVSEDPVTGSESWQAPAKTITGVTRAQGAVRIYLALDLSSPITDGQARRIELSHDFRLLALGGDGNLQRYRVDQNGEPFTQGPWGTFILSNKLPRVSHYLNYREDIEQFPIEVDTAAISVYMLNLEIESESTDPAVNLDVGTSFLIEGQLINQARESIRPLRKPEAMTPIIGATAIPLDLPPRIYNREPFTGGARSPNVSYFVDIPVVAPDNSTRYNLPVDTVFEVDLRLDDGYERPAGKIKAVTPIEGARELKLIPPTTLPYPNPDYADDLTAGTLASSTRYEYPPPPGPPNPPTPTASAIQFRKIQDLAIRIWRPGAGYNSQIHVPLMDLLAQINPNAPEPAKAIADFRKVPIDDVAKVREALTRKAADHIIATLEAIIRRQPGKPLTLIPIPRPFLGLRYTERYPLLKAMPSLEVLVSLLDTIRSFLESLIRGLEPLSNKSLAAALGLKSIKWGLECSRVWLHNMVVDIAWTVRSLDLFIDFAKGLLALGTIWIFNYKGSPAEYGPEVKKLLGGGIPGEEEGGDQEVSGVMLVCEDETSSIVLDLLFGDS